VVLLWTGKLWQGWRLMGKLRDVEEVVVPDGEGPLSEAITIRLPKKMLERIEKAAKDTENNRSDTVLHLLRWALAQYEKKGK
jgi:hypothetical protein